MKVLLSDGKMAHSRRKFVSNCIGIVAQLPAAMTVRPPTLPSSSFTRVQNNRSLVITSFLGIIMARSICTLLQVSFPTRVSNRNLESSCKCHETYTPMVLVRKCRNREFYGHGYKLVDLLVESSQNHKLMYLYMYTM